MSLLRKTRENIRKFRKSFKKLPVDVYIFDENEEIKLTNLYKKKARLP